MNHLKVKDYMTATPHSIEPSQTVSHAKEKMIEYKCRHLPVLSGGEIIGIVSDRDINAVGSFTKEDVSHIPVGDVMLGEVFSLDISSGVNEVVSTMVKNKIGSVLITDSGKLKGIFTESDALSLLERLTVS
jgi:acetoin utilization protein AcuB